MISYDCLIDFQWFPMIVRNVSIVLNDFSMVVSLGAQGAPGSPVEPQGTPQVARASPGKPQGIPGSSWEAPGSPGEPRRAPEDPWGPHVQKYF